MFREEFFYKNDLMIDIKMFLIILMKSVFLLKIISPLIGIWNIRAHILKFSNFIDEKYQKISISNHEPSLIL